ncbi:MAG: hypothetical protein DK306_001954 [Chloroflexi bacterium]|nr:MAG: hypothetical protein DK306_001954 [Chloroflexota bacterium]
MRGNTVPISRWKRDGWASVGAGVVLFAGVVLAACGGSDDSAAQTTAAPEQQTAEQETTASEEPEAREQAQAQAQTQAQGGAEEQAAEEAVEEEPEEQAAVDEQADEQAEEQVAAEVEEEESVAPIDTAALLSRLHMGSLSAQGDFRFRATIDLVTEVLEGNSRSLDLINALGTMVLSGVIAPSEDAFDIVISFGSDGEGGLPPFGLRQTGGVLYTNFGFGWEEHPPDADILELASVFIDSRELGFDFKALIDAIEAQGRLTSLLAGDAASWQSFATFLADQELLAPLESADPAVQSYLVTEFELDSIVRALVDPRELEDQLGVGGVYGGYDNRTDTMVRLDVDAESGLLLRVVAEIDEPSVDFDGVPATVFAYSYFSADSVHLELDVDPVSGAPVRFLVDMPSFRVEGETQYEGSLHIEFVVEQINAGGVVIEVPG